MDIQSFLVFLSSCFHSGFTFFCIFCLLGRFVIPKNIRPEFVNIQSAVNFSFAFGAILTVLFLAYEFYEINKLSSAYESYEYEAPAFDPYSIVFYANIAGWVLGTLFLIRRLRTNVILSLLVLILINATTIVFWVVALWQDYLPSAWETLYNNNEAVVIWKIFLFASMVMVIYIVLAKRKKLPYPSAWIR